MNWIWKFEFDICREEGICEGCGSRLYRIEITASRICTLRPQIYQIWWHSMLAEKGLGVWSDFWSSWVVNLRLCFRFLIACVHYVQQPSFPQSSDTTHSGHTSSASAVHCALLAAQLRTWSSFASTDPSLSSSFSFHSCQHLIDISLLLRGAKPFVLPEISQLSNLLPFDLLVCMIQKDVIIRIFFSQSGCLWKKIHLRCSK